MTCSHPAEPRPGPLADALASIRRAAAALEAERDGDARDALGEAVRILVLLCTRLDGRDGGGEIVRALRRIARRLKDADLLRDAEAAREAERAFATLACGLGASRREPGCPP